MGKCQGKRKNCEAPGHKSWGKKKWDINDWRLFLGRHGWSDMGLHRPTFPYSSQVRGIKLSSGEKHGTAQRKAAPISGNCANSTEGNIPDISDDDDDGIGPWL